MINVQLTCTDVLPILVVYKAKLQLRTMSLCTVHCVHTHCSLSCPHRIHVPAGLQSLQHNPYTEPLWKAAVTQYDRGMAPAELRIASKLRRKFHELEA